LFACFLKKSIQGQFEKSSKTSTKKPNSKKIRVLYANYLVKYISINKPAKLKQLLLGKAEQIKSYVYSGAEIDAWNLEILFLGAESDLCHLK
jgi:hypothetical protein